MGGRIVLIIGIVIAHLLGLVVYAVNVFYLKLTRGYDPKRRYTQNEDLDVLKSKRCCKIRSSKAMTMLVIYHVILEIVDFVIVFISESNRDSEYVLEWPLHWLLPGLHYTVIFCFMPVAMILGAPTFAHIGPINVFNAYEFLHLVIFWYAIFFMIFCAGTGRENLPPDLRALAAGYAAIPMGFSYLIMLFGAWFNRSCYHVEEDVISSREAVRTIKELLEQTISIEIKISCGHTTSNRRTTRYVELHSETQKYTFDSDNIRRILKPEHLSESIFKRKYTKLTVMDEIKPGDLFEMNKLERSKELLRMKHKGHDGERNVTMKTGSENRYLVQNDGIEPMPAMFSRGRYWIYACFGLSLPYKWYLYFSIGHLKYKITRKVYSQGASISNEPVDFEPEVLQPTQPSVQTYGDFTPPKHEARYYPLAQPMPYSVPSRPEYGATDSMERFQPHPSTPPPGYKEACLTISGNSQGRHNPDPNYTGETLV